MLPSQINFSNRSVRSLPNFASSASLANLNSMETVSAHQADGVTLSGDRPSLDLKGLESPGNPTSQTVEQGGGIESGAQKCGTEPNQVSPKLISVPGADFYRGELKFAETQRPCERPNLGLITVLDGNDDSSIPFSKWGAGSVDLIAPGIDIRSTVPGERYQEFSGTLMFHPSRDMSNYVHSPIQTDEVAHFTKFGEKSVDLTAPGQDIAATVPGGKYQEFSGTTMFYPR